MPVLPGAIRQNGYVVEDLDRAAHELATGLGVGPWICMRDLDLTGFSYRGAASAPRISIALANSGDLQLELIMPHDDEPSMYRAFLDSGRSGLQHHAWWTEDYDAVIEAARTAGWEVGHEGDMGGTRFVYYDRGALAAEVMELNELNRMVFDQVRRAGDSWDGVTDPVRDFA